MMRGLWIVLAILPAGCRKKTMGLCPAAESEWITKVMAILLLHVNQIRGYTNAAAEDSVHPVDSLLYCCESTEES